MSDIKQLGLCINVAIPAVDDDSVSLYEAVALINSKLQEVVERINTFDGGGNPYSPDNPPPYPVTSVNALKGNVTLSASNVNYDDSTSIKDKIDSINTEGNVKTVNFAKGDIVTVFVPDGGIDSATQRELIQARDAGAMLACDLNSSQTFNIFYMDRYYNPDRVALYKLFYSDAGVNSVNGLAGTVTLDADNIPYSQTQSVKDKIDSLPAEAAVKSVNTLTGNVVLTADNVNYADGQTIKQKIDSLPTEAPVKSVNTLTGDVVLTADNVNYAAGQTIKQKIETLNDLPVYLVNSSQNSIFATNNASYLRRGNSFMSTAYVQSFGVSFDGGNRLFGTVGDLTLPAGSSIDCPFLICTSPQSFSQRPVRSILITCSCATVPITMRPYVVPNEDTIRVIVTNESQDGVEYNNSKSATLYCNVTVISDVLGMIYLIAQRDE